jgi:hypothetical protein
LTRNTLRFDDGTELPVSEEYGTFELRSFPVIIPVGDLRVHYTRLVLTQGGKTLLNSLLNEIKQTPDVFYVVYTSFLTFAYLREYFSSLENVAIGTVVNTDRGKPNAVSNTISYIRDGHFARKITAFRSFEFAEVKRLNRTHHPLFFMDKQNERKELAYQHPWDIAWEVRDTDTIVDEQGETVYVYHSYRALKEETRKEIAQMISLYRSRPQQLALIYAPVVVIHKIFEEFPSIPPNLLIGSAPRLSSSYSKYNEFSVFIEPDVEVVWK